jgi:hypothetical protein
MSPASVRPRKSRDQRMEIDIAEVLRRATKVVRSQDPVNTMEHDGTRGGDSEHQQGDQSYQRYLEHHSIVGGTAVQRPNVVSTVASGHRRRAKVLKVKQIKESGVGNYLELRRTSCVR